MDALQRAVPVPQREIMVRRALGRQILRQRLPLATPPWELRLDSVEEIVEPRTGRAPD